MMWESVSVPVRILGLGAGRIWQRLLSLAEAGPLARWRLPAPTPDRLVLAPQDIRTADPTHATDIYAGIFAFSGHIVETGGRTPFEVAPASDDWARALHGFAWLRHLRAADSVLTRSNARALVDDWIRLGLAPRIAFEPETMARRVLSWLTQSPLILEDADAGFYRRFVKSLARHVRRLRGRMRWAPDGYPRLLAAIAVAEAGLALSGQARLLRQGTRRLETELKRQILADGGHVSRNPAVLIELLADLVPLRQAYAASGTPPPASLVAAIERMMPMLRFFRHRDGALAHFNGMGATPFDLVAALLAGESRRTRPVEAAAASGYQRLDAGRTTILMDTGPPPPVAVSGRAHAGCLAFEMSSGNARLIVNCGVADGEEWRRLARTTAAHSTVTIAEASSARILSGGRLARWLGNPIIAGPRDVPVARADEPDGIVVSASHDGYVPGYGYRHERSIRLAADGFRVDGEDRLVLLRRRGPRARADRFAVRFHLHPGVQAAREGAEILLHVPGGDTWRFGADGLEPALEESVYLCDVLGRRRTQQMVLAGRARANPVVRWRLSREARRPRAETAEPEG